MNIDNISAKAKILIRKSPPEVFSALVDANSMSKYWFTRRDDGLKEGETFIWYLGQKSDAFSFPVSVIELKPAEKLIFEWENGGKKTIVIWNLEETEDGNTILTIEEKGFSGNPESVIARVLDSTGGFNQVIVAAKAHIEYGVEINVVADHIV